MVPVCDQCSTRRGCLFNCLPEPQLSVLMPHVRERAVSVGDVLEREGEPSPVIGVVKVGLVKGSRTGPGTGAKAIVLLGRGRLIGFPGVFGHTSQLTQEAITPARVCELDTRQAIELAMPWAPFREALMATVARFVDCVADWSRILREDSFVPQLHMALRMIAAEEGNPSLRIPNHAELAGLLGARRETIGRHIRTLARQGLLQRVDRWRVVLTDQGAAARPLSAPRRP